MFKEKTGGPLGNFDVQYLGSVPVRKSTGNDVCADAVLRVKELANPPRRVYLVVTAVDISIIDAMTAEPIKDSPIRDVSFVSLDPKDKKIFTYITNNRMFNLTFCHVFRVPKHAKEIPLALNKAFKIAATMPVDFDPVADRKLSKRDSLADVITENEITAPDRKLASAKAAPRIAENKNVNTILGAFEAKYLGGVPVSGPRGNDVAEKALASLRGQNIAYEFVTIMVSTESIRTVEGLTAAIIGSVFMKNLSFTTVLGPQQNIFAFIAKDVLTGLTTCHLYQCIGIMAFEICAAISTASKIAREQFKALKSAFVPFSGDNLPTAIPASLEKLQVPRTSLSLSGTATILGAGQFGHVYLAKFQPEGWQPSMAAVKLLRRGTTPVEDLEFIHMAQTMAVLVHDSIVALLGVAFQHRPWLIVLELMKHGDLKSVATSLKVKKVKVTTREIVNVASQVCEGMKFVAQNNYIHMDLSARNVLVTENNIFKISDFGLARKLDTTNTYTMTESARLNVKWLAPECMRAGVFSEKSDVWAFGVTMWELASYGALPYSGVMDLDINARVTEGLRPEAPAGLDPRLYAILTGACWTHDPQERKHFHEVGQLLETLADAVQGQELRDLGALAVEGATGIPELEVSSAPQLPLPENQPWFQPYFSKETAVAIVMASTPSSFLVRRVANDKFALVVNDSGTSALTYLIKVQGINFVLGKHAFPTLDALVVFLSKMALKGNTGNTLYLGGASKMPDIMPEPEPEPEPDFGIADDDVPQAPPVIVSGHTSVVAHVFGGLRTQTQGVGIAKNDKTRAFWFAGPRTTSEVAAGIVTAGKGDFLVCTGPTPRHFILCVNDGGKAALYPLRMDATDGVSMLGRGQLAVAADEPPPTFPSMAAFVENGRRKGFTGKHSNLPLYLVNPLPLGIPFPE